MKTRDEQDMPEKSNSEEPLNEKVAEFVHSEGGWGWIVVLAVGFNMGVNVGIIGNYPLIYNKLVVDYKDTENHVFYAGYYLATWIGSISVSLKYIMVLPSTFFVSFFRPKNVGIAGGLLSAISTLACSFVTDIKVYFFTYGTCLSISQALILAACFAITPHYFKKKLSMANGIVLGLASIIIAALPFFTSLIIDNYGLSETFYFYTAVNIVSSMLCFTYIPCLPVDNEQTYGQRIIQSLGLDVFKKPKFVIWCIATFIGMFGWLIPIINIDHFSLVKFPDFNPAIINIAFPLVAGVASFVFGKLGDITKFNRVHYHTFSFLLYGALQLAIPFTQTFYQFIGLICLMGIMDGVYLTYRMTIATELAESSELSNQASGYVHAAMAPMAMIGPALAGKIYEIYHEYDLAFYLGGLACIICGAVLFVFILVPEIFNHCQSRQSRQPIIRF